MHTQPEPEPELKGPKGRAAAGAASKQQQRGNTAQRKREGGKSSRSGVETPDPAEDVVPQEVEDVVAAELLALGACG